MNKHTDLKVKSKCLPSSASSDVVKTVYTNTNCGLQRITKTRNLNSQKMKSWTTWAWTKTSKH